VSFTYLVDDVFRPDVLGEVDGQPKLIGSQCSKCGDVRFPIAQACPKCRAARAELREVPLSTVGKVIAACRIDRAPNMFRAPYVVAYVQLSEGPRVLCQLETESLEPSAVIGKSCALTVAPLFETEGRPVKGYKFKVIP
jgi:uncharacterized OB-fold protein